MPLFELDDGRPRLVQPMQPLPGSFAQDLTALLTHHLAAIAGEPLFPVRHRSSGPDHADLPTLLALDSTGRAVVIEGVPVLDDDTVVAALRHAGAAARMTATDLARAYHADPDRFPVDFAAFREQVAFGMATSRREGVRLVIVCSEIATEAGDTLGYLRGPGRHVDVLQLGVVRGVDDRRFLDVSPLARHESVRRPVEPTALRLVRSSEASFATAMAYEDGRRRPPAPSGGVPGSGHGAMFEGAGATNGAASAVSPGPSTGQGHLTAPGLPTTSAFPSAPTASRPTGVPGAGSHEVGSRETGSHEVGSQGGPHGVAPHEVAPHERGPWVLDPSTGRAAEASAARSGSVSPSAAVLPVAGAPSTQVGASTRAVPAVLPGARQSTVTEPGTSSGLGSSGPGAGGYDATGSGWAGSRTHGSQVHGEASRGSQVHGDGTHGSQPRGPEAPTSRSPVGVPSVSATPVSAPHTPGPVPRTPTGVRVSSGSVPREGLAPLQARAWAGSSGGAQEGSTDGTPVDRALDELGPVNHAATALAPANPVPSNRGKPLTAALALPPVSRTSDTTPTPPVSRTSSTAPTPSIVEPRSSTPSAPRIVEPRPLTASSPLFDSMIPGPARAATPSGDPYLDPLGLALGGLGGTRATTSRSVDASDAGSAPGAGGTPGTPTSDGGPAARADARAAGARGLGVEGAAVVSPGAAGAGAPGESGFDTGRAAVAGPGGAGDRAAGAPEPGAGDMAPVASWAGAAAPGAPVPDVQVSGAASDAWAASSPSSVSSPSGLSGAVAGPGPEHPQHDPTQPFPELATLAKRRRALTTLVWLRERRGQRLEALLQPDGSIELPDGARFFDPNEAAAYAAGSLTEVDGWRAWRLGDGGPTLTEATGRA